MEGGLEMLWKAFLQTGPTLILFVLTSLWYISDGIIEAEGFDG